jgi:hypothetical protein
MTTASPEFFPRYNTGIVGVGEISVDGFLLDFASQNLWDSTALPADNSFFAPPTFNIVQATLRFEGENIANIDLRATLLNAEPNPPVIAIEKRTNGREADTANDADVPRIAPGSNINWTYAVSNIGSVAVSEQQLIVTDSQPGVTPVLDMGTDNGDGILEPAETWTYVATAQALNLAAPPPSDIETVPGCNDGRPTYTNDGQVYIADAIVFETDSSHYCNEGDVDADGITDSMDNCFLIPNGPLIPDAGGNSQRDTNSDGYGNVCDPDFDNALNIDFADLAVMKSRFFTSDPDADLNGDGKVDFADLAILKAMFFGPPGPSGLVY